MQGPHLGLGHLRPPALDLLAQPPLRRRRDRMAASPLPEDDEEDDEEIAEESESGVMEVEVELVMVLQLFEEGRARPDDLPVVELQLDVDDFERLHETLDFALQQEERSRRRK